MKADLSNLQAINLKYAPDGTLDDTSTTLLGLKFTPKPAGIPYVPIKYEKKSQDPFHYNKRCALR